MIKSLGQLVKQPRASQQARVGRQEVPHSQRTAEKSAHYHARVITATKRLNPSSTPAMVRQGLVTSRNTGG